MCAELRHDYGFLAVSLERPSQPRFAFAVMVFPRIVKEIDAGFQCALHQARGLFLIFRGAQVKSDYA